MGQENYPKNEIFMHGNVLFMHENEIVMHGYSIFMHKNEIFMHETLYTSVELGVEMYGRKVTVSVIAKNTLFLTLRIYLLN